MKTPRILKNADIALAMELHTAGVQYQHIAVGLGVCAKTLRASLRYAEQNGYRKEAAPVCSRVRKTFVNCIAAGVLENRARRVSRHCANLRREVEA